MKNFIYLLAILIIPALCFGQKNSKTSISWDGSTDGDWQTTTNWTPETIPGAGDDVTIPNSCSNYPTIDDGAIVAECNNLTIESSANVIIATNGRMTINGTLANSAGNTGIILQAGAGGVGSLIHSTASINGTAQIYLSAEQWHYVSTPIESANSSNFNSLNFMIWDATLEWDGTSTTPWEDYSGAIVNAKGYATYENSTTTRTLTGVMHQGIYTIPVAMSATGAASKQGWNFVGNPYASAIDWSLIDNAIANLDAAIYYYNGTTYASWNGSGTNGGTQYVPPCQGFFVKCNNTAGGTLTFNNDDRVHNSQSFWKEDKNDDIIRLLTQGNGYTDESIIRFIEGATYGYDGNYDAYKIISPNPDVPQIYSLDSIRDTQYSINSLPLNPEAIAIPIGFQVTPSGIYSISASEINTDIRYLLFEDLVLDSIMDLRTIPVYLFDYAGGVDENRFILYIIPNSAPICSNPINDFEIYEANMLDSTFAEDVFIDADNDELIYYAKQSDGSNLPYWLSFTPENKDF